MSYTIELYSIDVENGTLSRQREIFDYQDLDFTTALNEAGSCTFSLNVNSVNASPALLQRYRTIVVIKKDGGGLPNFYYASDYTGDLSGVDGFVEIECTGYAGVLSAKLTDKVTQYSGLQAGVIAETLLDLVQNRANGDVLITAGSIESVGTTSDTLEYQDVLSAYQNQSDNIVGYDFEVVASYGAGGLLTGGVLNIAKGFGRLRKDLNPISLGNIESISFASTNEVYNYVTFEGTGTGDEVVTVFSQDAGSQKAYTRREAFRKDSDVKTGDALQLVADSFIARNSAPTKRLNVQLMSTVFPFGTINIGDVLLFNIYVEGTFLDFRGSGRVLEINVRVDETGREIITPLIEFYN